jgi:hypothetical protein
MKYNIRAITVYSIDTLGCIFSESQAQSRRTLSWITDIRNIY